MRSDATVRVSITVGVVATAALIIAPLAGWPAVTRLPAVLVPALCVLLLTRRPWRWSDVEWRALDGWVPSRRTVWLSALAVGLLLFWIVLTRFRSGEINGVDFTVYFDRPSFQTLHGRPLLVETADDLGRAHKSALAQHAYWAMFPLALLYVVPTPMWLLALSVVAVVAGAVHTLRIMQRLGAGGMLASASALAFVLNDNAARTLNYGFHPEVLYAWFIPWMIDAGLRGRRAPYVGAALAAIAVKEDACMPLLAVAVALGFHRYREMSWTDRALFLAAPTLLALLNLGVYYAAIVPALTAGHALVYGSFWATFGPTPMTALVGMMRNPGQVIARSITSGFFRRVITPHLFLPVLGWRWMLGAVPIVVLYGAASNEQLRSFGIYYAIVLVPFLVVSGSVGAMAIANRLAIAQPRRQAVAAIVILAGAILAGSTDAGYSLRPWRTEVGAVASELAKLPDERVLVQSGLYPHAGYSDRVQLLTPDAVADPRNAGAIVLLAPGVGAYPFSDAQRDALTHLPAVVVGTPGLIAVRLPR